MPFAVVLAVISPSRLRVSKNISLLLQGWSVSGLTNGSSTPAASAGKRQMWLAFADSTTMLTGVVWYSDASRARMLRGSTMDADSDRVIECSWIMAELKLGSRGGVPAAPLRSSHVRYRREPADGCSSPASLMAPSAVVPECSRAAEPSLHRRCSTACLAGRFPFGARTCSSQQS